MVFADANPLPPQMTYWPTLTMSRQWSLLSCPGRLSMRCRRSQSVLGCRSRVYTRRLSAYRLRLRPQSVEESAELRSLGCRQRRRSLSILVDSVRLVSLATSVLLTRRIWFAYFDSRVSS